VPPPTTPDPDPEPAPDPGPTSTSYVAFESGQVRPLAWSADGSRLFVANTPANSLDIYSVSEDNFSLDASVAVGLEPVAVAVGNNEQVWVVNHLSDSVSIVDVGGSPRVVQTLLVGDEPRDIVFAGANGERAFITAAYRGQNHPTFKLDDLTTPGLGRADVWVFDANSLGSNLSGTPITIVTLFGDTPRPLAVSPDGATVYAGIFHSGNKTTAVHTEAVCDGGAGAGTCPVDGVTAPGGLPAPNVDSDDKLAPEVGLE